MDVTKLKRIPFTVVLSYFLLGIEELGIQLEEPFSVLPLHKITNGIGLSAEEHVQWFLNDSERANINGETASSSSTHSAAAGGTASQVNGDRMFTNMMRP